MVTMGVNEVKGALEISVARWSPEGARTNVFDGRLSEIDSASRSVLERVLTLAALFKADRAAIDPGGNAEWLARELLVLKPEVFATQSGGEHNAASLAEVAWRRAQMATVPLDSEPEISPRVLGIDRTGAQGVTDVVLRLYYPARHPLATLAVISLEDAVVLTRGDGTQIVEVEVPLASVSLVYPDSRPQVGGEPTPIPLPVPVVPPPDA